MRSLLKEKTIVITGASKGIGEACVGKCLAEGARVIAVARSEKHLDRLISKNDSEKLTVESVDISVENEVIALFDRIRKKYCAIHGLVQCAAQFYKATIESTVLAKWQNSLDVNLTGAFLCLREAIKCMPNGGSIVNIGSLSGVPGFEKFSGFGSYGVSKYGLYGLTEMAAVELREKGIRVNQVSPGAVDTEMLQQAAPQLPPAMIPNEVAAIISFLLSEESRAVNGENIIMTGHPKGPGEKKQ